MGCIWEPRSRPGCNLALSLVGCVTWSLASSSSSSSEESERRVVLGGPRLLPEPLCPMSHILAGVGLLAVAVKEGAETFI